MDLFLFVPGYSENVMKYLKETFFHNSIEFDIFSPMNYELTEFLPLAPFFLGNVKFIWK